MSDHTAQPDIDAFLEELERHDGVAPLSEAKVLGLSEPTRRLVVEDESGIVAVGAVAVHPQADGVERWAAETAVHPSLRFVEFEATVLAQTVGLVPSGALLSVWSTRSTLDRALVDAGMESTRSLAFMTVRLPLPPTSSAAQKNAIRPLGVGEEERLLAINQAAFGGHREAGSLDAAELEVLMGESWFDRHGILLSEHEGRTTGFCWTKVHAGGEGEIYRIGVDPAAQGRGIGKELVEAGFSHLAEARGCTVGVLWVDEANRQAMKLYKGLGMEIARRNREFVAAN